MSLLELFRGGVPAKPAIVLDNGQLEILEILSSEGTGHERDIFTKVKDPKFASKNYTEKCNVLKELARMGLIGYFNPHNKLNNYSYGNTHAYLLEDGAAFVSPSCPVPLTRT